MDETGTIRDRSGKGNVGTTVGMDYTNIVRSGRGRDVGLSFNGSNERGNVADNVNLRFGTENFSVLLAISWTTAPAFRDFLHKREAGNGAGWAIFLDTISGKISSTLEATDGTVSNTIGTRTNLNDGALHVISFSFNRISGVGKVFVDGVNDTNTGDLTSLIGKDISWSGDLYIASDSDGSFTKCDMYRVCLFKGLALESIQHAYLYKALLNGEI